MVPKSAKETKVELKKHMERIGSLWEYYFLENQYLARLIRYPNNTNHRYVGTIIGNFIDTFDIIYKTNSSRGYGGDMSLMQAIYIQQDFIEELLHIFKCGIDKSNLKKDTNYDINRDIRNELMGHPIRKFRGELISTTLLAYNRPAGCINYMRYHKDTDFSFEMVSHNVQEIIARHTDFIKIYFEKIINSINIMMISFIEKLRKMDSMIDTIKFPKLLDFVFVCFESIERQDYIYDKESLKTIYEKRNDHIRYQNLINCFYLDLREHIKGKLENLENIFNPKEVEFQNTNFEPPQIIIKIIKSLSDDSDDELDVEPIVPNRRRCYNYELGKLADMYSRLKAPYEILQEDFSDNELIIEELGHMESHRYSKIEYYCAYRLLRQEVEKHEESYS